jgi:hypothetical protein
MDRRGLAPVLRRQKPVAGTQGQAVGRPHRRGTDYLHRQHQIAGHAADQNKLLYVLLAEHRDIGHDDVEELCDHGRHAIEMPRPELPAQLG